MSSVGNISDLPVFGAPAAQSTAVPTNKQDFLKLLVAQMKYQDPLNPMQGSEYAAQLAQFTSVEELQNINSKMDSSNQSNQLLAMSVNNTLATTLIGKDVRAMDDTVTYDGVTNPSIGYRLPGFCSPVTVEISNSSGQVIRTIQVPNAPAGDNSADWDGKDGRGNRVPPGSYKASVSGTDITGTQTIGTPIMIGKIDGVRFVNGMPVLLLQGREIAFSSVLDILEPGESGAAGMLTRLLRKTQ